MQRPLLRACGLALALGFLAAPLRAESPPDPLRLLPEKADLVGKIDNPRRLIEVVTSLDALKQLQALPPVRELFDSTNTRRFYQLVGYYEKELGLPWPELLDQLAGGGAAFALKIGPEPPPGVVVVQGKNEKLLRRFAERAAQVIEEELARRESKERLEKTAYRDLETYHLGKEFHAAVLGSALVLANTSEQLHEVLDLRLDGKKGIDSIPALGEAQKGLPPSPLAWVWLNLDVVHNAPQAKDLFAQPRNDPVVTVAAGGLLDLVRRAPFVCGALYQDKGKLITTVRLPTGHEGMPDEMAIHIPPAGTPPALPLLEPQGVLFSTSFYMDLSKFWEYRQKLFNEKQVKDFEDFNNKSALFLVGNPFSQLTAKAGTCYRVVVTFKPRPDAPKGPEGLTSQLSYGVSVTMRDAGFGRSMETLLRGAALLASTQVRLKLTEQQYGEVKIIGYKFDQADRSLKINAENTPILRSVSPSFAVVGNQFVVASSLELCREMIELVRRDAAPPPAKGPEVVGDQTRLYGAGGALLLGAIQDQLFTQAILGQAATPEEARAEVRQFIDWVRGLGALEVETRYGPHEYRQDFMYSPQRAKSSRRNTPDEAPRKR